MSKSYSFIDHTADIAVELKGSNLEELFRAGAEAWLASVIEGINIESDDSLEMKLSASTEEELLITFLNELNYLFATKKWICLSVQSVKINCHQKNFKLSAVLRGTILKNDPHLKNEIKAVTYHQVDIVKIEGSCSTIVVFDI
jgi:SHS2 domain-containing protein